MTSPASGDRVRVSVTVAVAPPEAFRLFTEDIDKWWRRGLKFRAIGGGAMLHLEPFVGGRLYEVRAGAPLSRRRAPSGPRDARSARLARPGDAAILQTGTVVEWRPPERLAFEWRAANFAPEEVTVVEVDFEPARRGTLVTVTHRGWASIRPDHPVRHGEAVAVFIRRFGLWWGDQMTSLREEAERVGSRS